MPMKTLSDETIRHNIRHNFIFFPPPTFFFLLPSQHSHTPAHPTAPKPNPPSPTAAPHRPPLLFLSLPPSNPIPKSTILKFLHDSLELKAGIPSGEEAGGW